MKPKLKDTTYEVYDNDDDSLEFEEEFPSLKNAKEYIKDDTMGGKFVIWKVNKTRKQISVVKQQVVPCHGGWYGGHSISDEDEKNETKNPYCIRCGYKLKVRRPLFDPVRMVALNPLQHKDDNK